MGLFDFFKPAAPPYQVKRDYTDINTESAELREDTDHPPYRQTRGCPDGSCIVSRRGNLTANDAAQTAMAGASFVAGMIDWGRLGPRDEDEGAAVPPPMSISDRMTQGALIARAIASDAEVNARLEQLTPEQRAVVQIQREAMVSGQTFEQSARAMGFNMGELQPVETRRLR